MPLQRRLPKRGFTSLTHEFACRISKSCRSTKSICWL
jgi:ribosomal protein L15